MALAVIVGLLLGNLASDSFNSVLNSELLEPIKTMYMNAIKMVVAPVVYDCWDYSIRHHKPIFKFRHDEAHFYGCTSRCCYRVTWRVFQDAN